MAWFSTSILEENAHRAGTGALLDQVPIESGQLWIMDRNFCVRTFLFRIMEPQDASFLVRWHSSTMPYKPIKPLRFVGRCDTGEVFEQAIWVDDPECKGRRYRLRRIVLQLDKPTRDGETEIILITNLPKSVSPELCCRTYRGRWEIEGHFQKLTDLLHCEIPTLGYPRAALFGFAMSVLAGNAVAILKGNLRAAHGDEMVNEISNHALVSDIAEVYPGMMIAAPPSVWSFLDGRSAGQVAELLEPPWPPKCQWNECSDPDAGRRSRGRPGRVLEAGFSTLRPRNSWTSPGEGALRLGRA